MIFTGRPKGSKNKVKSIVNDPVIEKRVEAAEKYKLNDAVPYTVVTYMGKDGTQTAEFPTSELAEPSKLHWFILGLLWAGLILAVALFLRR